MIHVLDLNFLGIDHAIASFLIESSAGPILIETGPHSTFESMKGQLAKHGYEPEDVKHVLLTHIHFDHAGAAWAFADHGAKIYLHPFGKPHMEDPTKLYNSAKMIYGDEMERLWGAMEKIPADQLITPDHLEQIGWETSPLSFFRWIIGDKTFHAKQFYVYELLPLLAKVEKN